MKYLKYTLAVIAAGAMVTACDLDEIPQYSQNSKIVFQSSENAEMALLGCYAYMTETSAFGQWWQEGPLRGCGLTWAKQNTTQNDLNQLECLLNNDGVSIMWKGGYKAINETNVFMESMQECELSDDYKVQLIGEARALRGIMYYYYVTHFGEVPLKTSASSSDGVSGIRNSREDIFAQVLADLEYATQISPTANPGRITSWTAKAWLGRTYMRMAQMMETQELPGDLSRYPVQKEPLTPHGLTREECLLKAQEYFKDVYENGPYTLEGNYADLWRNYYSGNEAILLLATTLEGTSSTFNRSTNRFAPTNSTGGIAWGTNRVQRFVYDWHWATYPNDPRMETSYLTHWRNFESYARVSQVLSEPSPNDSSYAYPYWTYSTEEYIKEKYVYRKAVARLPYELFADPSNPDTATVARWEQDTMDSLTMRNRSVDTTRVRGKLVEKHKVSNTNHATYWFAAGDGQKWPYYGKLYTEDCMGQRSSLNIMLYRLGELLIDYADVENELGNPAKAVGLVNEVLQRARGSRAKATEPADWPKSLSQDELRDKIFKERILETVGETNSFDNVRMRGVSGLKEILSMNNRHNYTLLCDSVYKENAGAETANFLDFLYNGGDLDSESGYQWLFKNLRLPIPSSEIDYNDALTNSDNNYGY